MTLCAVSSNEGAHSLSSASGSAMDVTVVASKLSDTMVSSQDSGISSMPSSSYNHVLGKNLRITACANQGGRKYMEDRVHVEVKRCEKTGDVLWTYVAVYDGHGGAEASQYCREYLLKNIEMQAGFDSEDDDEFLEAIRSGFLHTHHQMWMEVDSWDKTTSGYPSTAGTTASCAFIRRGKLYVGHVGDSAILLTSRSHPQQYKRLTDDHKPETPAEKKRIQASGGQVMLKAAVHRVVWTRAANTHEGPIRKNTPTQTIPFLAVARSLGDFWSYCEETQEFAVSPNPDVRVIELLPDHHSIILCSDGLTSVMSDEQEAEIMYGLAVEEDQPSYFKNPFEHPNHARIMMRRVLQRWRTFRSDNISIVTVVFDRQYSTSSQMLIDDDMSESDDAPVELPANASIDAELADHPLSLIRVTKEKSLRYKTTPVQMKYGGSFDANFNAVHAVGAGFVSHATENEAIESAKSASVLRLDEYYDLLGQGERGVTPENDPPATSTNNLTNKTAPQTNNVSETKRNTRLTISPSAAMDELRRDANAAVASAHAAAASLASSDRPTTPENRADVGFAVLRSSRSAAKRKSMLGGAEKDDEDQQPSSSKARKEAEEESEVEGGSDDVHDPVLLQSLPFGSADESIREEPRTPSPIGDKVNGEQVVRATPLCNSTSTEREVIRRVTRSAAATTTVSSRMEMIVVDRPATRRSARKLVQDGCEGSGTPPVRTPKPVLEVGETIASRTRSRDASQTTPPSSNLIPPTSASGSRKRPRTAMSTSATPLLAKISFMEMNENTNSSLGLDESPSSGTPIKNVEIESPWVHPERYEEDEEIGCDVAAEGERFYEMKASVDDDDDDTVCCAEPPVKRFRLWGIIKKWWTGEQ